MDGSEGSDSDGAARAAKGVGSMRKGCERRWRSGRSKTGRVGPLRPGSSICHSGGSGRASAIVGEGMRAAGWTGARLDDALDGCGGDVGNKLLPSPRPSARVRAFPGCG